MRQVYELRKALFVFIATAVLTAGIAGCDVTRVDHMNASEQTNKSGENQPQGNAGLHSETGLTSETNASSSSGTSASPSPANSSGAKDYTGTSEHHDISKPSTAPPALLGSTLAWNGFELIREDYQSYSQNVSVPNNVITTDDKTLTVFFANSSGSDNADYGMTELIQVKLDDGWFTIPVSLAQREAPLTLAPFSMESDPFSLESMIEYSIDLTPLGNLPAGQYRFVERFFMERLQYEYYTLAYFWVIKPGDAHPPEAETSGQARIEDIIFYVAASFEARRVITDKDETIDMLITNTSGKKYVSTKAVLEKLQNGKWEHFEYTYSNLGLVSGWQTTTSRFYLDKQLEAGEYRIKLSLNVFGTASGVEPVCTFSVIPFNDAPEPVWDISRLVPSHLDDSSLSTDVKITVANSILNKANSKLDLTVTADKLYGFGDPFSIEVLISGKWYGIPLNISFTSLLYTTDSTVNLTCYPVGAAGILPAGQYRIIKEFNLLDEAWETSSSSVFLTKEFATVEFTVEETLER